MQGSNLTCLRLGTRGYNESAAFSARGSFLEKASEAIAHPSVERPVPGASKRVQLSECMKHTRQQQAVAAQCRLARGINY